MSDLNDTPKGMRTTIAVLGRRNAGKSSLINSLVGFDLAIVSPLAGTTTDPVDKAVEISPLGPCLIVDTAGIDDDSQLGELRTQKTRQVIADADIGLITIGDGEWTDYEEEIWQQLKRNAKPTIVVVNKCDLATYPHLYEKLEQKQLDFVLISTVTDQGVDQLKDKLGHIKQVSSREEPSLIGDLVLEGDLVVLVVPIDPGAPQGRLILPQVQTIRDLLDHNATAIVVKENELARTLIKLRKSPRLVITDSQVVHTVNSIIPLDVPLTTFSILFSRFKGNLNQMVEGASVIEQLRDGDKVLIAEACSHHVQADDIGRIKIPHWIRQYTDQKPDFEIAAGPIFPQNIKDYRLIIQCGGCTITRRAYLNRLETARENGVPITNYGIAISYIQGILDRTIAPFAKTTH